MPAAYEAIKRSVRKRNPDYSEEEVKSHAARIFNSTPQGQRNPVGPHSDEREKKRRGLKVPPPRRT
jgi:hypothetical protein